MVASSELHGNGPPAPLFTGLPNGGCLDMLHRFPWTLRGLAICQALSVSDQGRTWASRPRSVTQVGHGFSPFLYCFYPRQRCPV